MTQNMIFFLFNVTMKNTIHFHTLILCKRPLWPIPNMNNILVLLVIILVASFKIAIARKDVMHQRFTESSDLKGHGVDEGKIKSIDSLLQSYVHDKKVNCLAAFVAKGGNVVYKKSFGWKDIENQVPATI